MNDTSTQHQRPQSIANSVAEAIAEQALLAQLQGHNAANSDAQLIPSTMSNELPHQSQALQAQQALHMEGNADHTPTGVSESPLIQTASAASQQLEPAPSNHDLIDPGFGLPNSAMQQSFNIPIDMSFRAGDANTTSDLSWTQPPGATSMSSFGSLSIPQQDPMAGYEVLANSTRQKPRGRFDDVRRKEVSHIRKQGACIRCRMLKKPCSGETPCKTCANVETARIWKGKCIRTRLSEEMPLWSAKVFQAQAQAVMAAAAHRLQGEGTSCSFEVRFPSRPGYVNFPARRFEHIGLQAVLVDGDGGDADASAVFILQLSDDKAEESVGAYVRETVEASIASQTGLTKSILAKTHELSEAATKAAGTDGDTQPKTATRSSYNQQGDVLNHVLELWVLTELLTSGGTMQLRLTPAADAAAAASSTDSAASTTEDLSPTSTSHHLMQAQLLATMETRCSKLSKNVLNEVERRLLQRQQTSRFTTLLAALLFLRCVERMTAYFHSQDSARQSHGGDEDGQAALGAAVDSAPDPAPSALWPSGPRFADTLASLLRMRALPPKTKISLAGTLESLRDGTPKKGGSGGGGGEEVAAAVEDWVDGLRLDAKALKEKRDGEATGVGEGAGFEGWDLRFVAGVLLPER